MEYSSLKTRASAPSASKGGARSFRGALASVALVGAGALGCGQPELLAKPFAEPPGGLLPEEVPQWVSVSFDDNFVSGYGSATGGMRWALESFALRTNAPGSGVLGTADGTPARTTFFCNSIYIAERKAEPEPLAKLAWHTALEQGHEIGNHTHSHFDGRGFSVGEWKQELALASDWLTRPFDADEDVVAPDPAFGAGVPRKALTGFRAPYLSYNDALFTALAKTGLAYDSSIEACWGPRETGGNCAWPYTLERGSPDGAVLTTKFGHALISAHPAILELPVSALIVPPDALAAHYGIRSGLRRRLALALPEEARFEEKTGKLTPLDITLFVEAQMSGAEVLATLKYSLDLRRGGNRAPMIFVAHTHVYAANYPHAPHTTLEERQGAILGFLDYALSNPEVRVRPLADIVRFIADPVPLRNR